MNVHRIASGHSPRRIEDVHGLLRRRSCRLESLFQILQARNLKIKQRKNREGQKEGVISKLNL